MYSPRSPEVNLSSELSKVINERNVLSMRRRMKVLNALDENNKKSIEERNKNLRSQAIKEILTSELTYLRQLEIITEFFLKPIFEGRLLNHTLLSTLSENIKTLYNVSGELIEELKKDAENIADAFYKLAPFFKLYSVYAYDYEHVLNLIETMQNSDNAFRNFISNQESRPEVGTKLPALLITPVQRVPRYRLLLREVLQYTPSNHKEHNSLQACLVEVEKAATHINSLLSQSEENQKLLKLQKKITNKIILVRPGRKLIKEGSLMRVSRKGNSVFRRYFILLSDTLLYCKGDPGNSLTVCCVLPLSKCKVESVLTGGLFRITCSNEILLLYSERNDSMSWIQNISDAIKKYSECRQTLRKDSSSRIPLRHNEIHKLPIDNITMRRSKRKRPVSEEEVHLNSSKIMYINDDKEEDATNTSTEHNCLPLFKKIKRFNTRNTPEINNAQSGPELQSSIKYSNYNSILPCNNLTESTENRNKMEENEHHVSSIIGSKLNLCNTSCYESRSSSTTVKIINNIFTYVTTSVKDIFKFR